MSTPSEPDEKKLRLLSRNTMIADRRRYRRYKPRQDTFVAVNPEGFQLGRILNIGKGGLAFICVDNEKPIVGSLTMEIFLANDRFHLPEIPYKIVSEFSLAGNISDHSIKLRRCGVEYGDLTHFQSYSVYYFIESYTKEQKVR